LIDFTPELRAEAVKLVSKYKLGPIFTPPVVSQIDGPLAMLMGAFVTNWPGAAYDPETHMIYAASQSGFTALGLVKPSDPKIDMNYVQGSAATGMRTTLGSGGGAGADASTADRAQSRTPAPATSAAPAAAAQEGGGGGLTVQGLPLIKPPYGRITAIDMNKGEIAWMVPHGETPDNVKNHPALKGLTIPRTGQSGNIGTLVTKTLVIAGEPRVTTTAGGVRGAMLRAYDKADGHEVGAVYMPAPQSGSPMTYLHNGRQYIVLAISGGNYSGELLAFRLPQQQ
jgi:quinoprotein glucose dehydrogenase